MPHITVDETTYATLRAAAIERGCSNEAIVLDLLQQSLAPFDPRLLDGYEHGQLLVAYYDGRYAGVGVYVESGVDRGERPGRGASREPIMAWCPWFAPIIAGQRTRFRTP